MAFSIGSVIAKIEADATGFQDGLKKAEGAAKSFADKFDGIGKNVEKAMKSLAVVGGAVAAGLVVVGKQSVDAFIDAERQIAATNKSLENTAEQMKTITKVVPGATTSFEKQIEALEKRRKILKLTEGDHQSEIESLNKEINALELQLATTGELASSKERLVTVANKNAISFERLREEATKLGNKFLDLGFDDEETAMVFSKSISITKDLAESQKEMALAADFARLKNIPLTESANALQMAYMGNARVLKAYGIEIDDTTSKTDIMRLVSEKAAGQADAYMQTTAGKMAALNEKIGNIKENLGGVIITALTPLIEKLAEFATKANEWFGQNEEKVRQWGETAAYWMGQVVGWITQFVTYLSQNQELVVGFFIAVSVAIGIWVAAFIIANFWVLVIIGVITLLGTWLYTNRDIIIAWANEFVARIQAIGLTIQATADLIVNRWNDLVGRIRDIGNRILDAIMWPFNEAKKRIDEAVNYIKDKLDFTKRHSPSVIDIIEHGVKLANDALSDLAWNTNITPNVAAAGITGGDTSSRINNVTVNMSGAYIGSNYEADSIGRRVGDSIVRQLQKNVRV